MTLPTASFAKLQELVRLQRFGEACHVRNRIAELTGVRLVDRGPLRGLEVDRSDELPEGVSLLADRTLDDAMDRISRRVMRAEFGDNGRPTSREQVGESGVDSGSRDGRDPGGALEPSIEAGNAKSRQRLLAPTGSQRGSLSVAADPTPGQSPYSYPEGRPFDG
jgi:hypothetical protein